MVRTGRELKNGRRERHLYEVLIVSLGRGGGTRRFSTSRSAILGIGAGLFLLSVVFTLSILMFTPVAMVVPIPNPLLEQRYGKQILETQERLHELAEQVLLLRDYNTQLRKALGDQAGRDTVKKELYPPSLLMGRLQNRPDGERGISVVSVPGSDDGPVQGSMEELPPVALPRREIRHDRLPLLAPMAGFVSQGYNPDAGHYGIDFPGKRGTPVYAAAQGIVVFSSWTYEDGNMIIVAHGGGYLTVYKHNQTLLKNIHGVVQRGEPIALLGTSGQTSKGPHLHFEVWKDGSPQDPEAYLLRSSRVQ
jgi:murein DD-endopeptidase MepM/ murein hydrolase activator NlpD